MEIAGKKVLVTGGAKRVGRAICLEFAKRGAKVAIHFSRSEREALELLESIGGEKAGHCAVRCELSDSAASRRMMEALAPLDILVNNASTFRQTPLPSESVEEAKKQFDVNFWAPVELMKSFVASAPSAGELAIVNILDQRIVKTDAKGFSYPLSKKALAEATLSAALQYAPRVRVNAIAPGPVFPPAGMESSKMEETLRGVPLRRPVSPEDLAKSCAHLASNSSITGAVLFVDCGQSLAG